MFKTPPPSPEIISSPPKSHPWNRGVNSVNSFFFANHASVPIRPGKPMWRWPSLASSRSLQRSVAWSRIVVNSEGFFLGVSDAFARDDPGDMMKFG